MTKLFIFILSCFALMSSAAQSTKGTKEYLRLKKEFQTHKQFQTYFYLTNKNVTDKLMSIDIKGAYFKYSVDDIILISNGKVKCLRNARQKTLTFYYDSTDKEIRGYKTIFYGIFKDFKISHELQVNKDSYLVKLLPNNPSQTAYKSINFYVKQLIGGEFIDKIVAYPQNGDSTILKIGGFNFNVETNNELFKISNYDTRGYTVKDNRKPNS